VNVNTAQDSRKWNIAIPKIHLINGGAYVIALFIL
jgi:hypothetical protein